MRSALAGLGALGLGIVLVTAACGSDDPSGGPAAGGSAGTGGTGGSDAAAGGSGGAAGDGSAGSGCSGGFAGGGAAGAGGTVAGDGGVCGPVGGGGTPCEKSCAKSLAAAPQGICEVLDPAVCKLRCEKQLAKYPACAKESQAVVDCAANAGCFTCPFETPQLGGCDAERQAEAACTVCEHTPGESLCSYCGKNNCCAAAKAITLAKDFTGWADCIELCSGTSSNCATICGSAFPDAGKAADAYKACLATPCPAACNASAAGSDVVRDFCKAVVSCGGTLSLAECEQSMRVWGSNCGEYHWKALECYLAKGVQCDATTGIVTEPSCEAIRDSCPSTKCFSSGMPSGECTEGCGDWAASCAAPGTSCECTFGKNLGKKFTVATACDSGAMELACSL